MTCAERILDMRTLQVTNLVMFLAPFRMKVMSVILCTVSMLFVMTSSTHMRVYTCNNIYVNIFGNVILN
jgi:hypothetical protein